MTATPATIRAALTRGKIRGHWLRCPGCSGRNISWSTNAYDASVLTCADCDKDFGGASELALAERDDSVGRFG
jgi:hypothetical protein